MKLLESFKVMRSGPVFRLVSGASVSRLATLAFNAAMAVYVLDLTGRAADLGLALLVGTLPMFALGLVTGVVTDHVNRKNIIIVCDAVRVLVALAFLVLSALLDNESTVLLVYATVFCFSVAEAFVATAFSSIVPDVIEERDILDTNNLILGIGDAIRMIGPVVGVLLYSLGGFVASTVFTMVLFGLGVFLQWGVRYVRFRVERESTGLAALVRDEARMFWKLATQDVRLTSLLSNGFTTHLFMFPFIMIGLPYVITQTFSAQPVEYGYLEAVCALGAILSLLVVPHTKPWGVSKSLLRGIFGMIAGSAVFLLLLVGPVADLMQDQVVARLGVLSVGSFLLWLAFGVYGVYFVSFMHENVRSDMLGKGQSLVMVFNALGRILGFLLFGVLFDHSLAAAVITFVAGMALKLVVHWPFVIADRKLQLALAEQAPTGGDEQAGQPPVVGRDPVAEAGEAR